LADQLRVTPAGEVGLDPPLEREHAHLVEPNRLRAQQTTLCEFSESRSAPKRKRLSIRSRSLHHLIRAQGVRASLGEAFEAIEIACSRRDVQHVRLTPSLNRVAPKRPAEIRDVTLDKVARRRGRPFPPDLVDQPTRGNRLVRRNNKDRENGLTART